MNTLDDLENRTKRVEEKIKLEWMEKVDKALTALKENLQLNEHRVLKGKTSDGSDFEMEAN